jgi:acetylornithine deacetylase/succinyl-diaminopimelate desuccinylase-like protein
MSTAPATPALAAGQAAAFADGIWEQEILPALHEYIRIPNKSQSFDPAWREHGHMERAVALIEGWCRKQPIPGLVVEVHRLEGRTPLILMEVPGTAEGTVLLYGHLDKQPEIAGWRPGLGPWEPVRQGDKLYGRGGADDGYSAFASLLALRVLHEQKLPHARCVILIEAGEESGSPDLPAYIDALAARIGQPSVDVLREGVHSGSASGVVPSSFRIVRQLLGRIEDAQTGRILLDELHAEIPSARRAQIAASAEVLRHEAVDSLPWAGGTHAISTDVTELILNRTWRPALSVTGVDGMPPMASAGNVLRPYTAVKLSMRLPPRVDPARAVAALKAALEKDPPYGAKVTVTGDAAAGWDAPELAPWLERAMEEASRAYFGKPAMAMGEGGTIPFMAMLGKKFPAAQFLITGVLGPDSNAHGPNEFLHIPTAKRLTCCVAHVIASHAAR